MDYLDEATQVIFSQLYPDAIFEEWWGTGTPNEFVVVDLNSQRAYRVTVQPETIPSISPGAWMEGEGKHPYTGQDYLEWEKGASDA